jgi:hypothetical protein
LRSRPPIPPPLNTPIKVYLLQQKKSQKGNWGMLTLCGVVHCFSQS